MAEQHFAFIKNNRIVNIAVFATKDETLADAVAKENDYDDAVWVGTDIPVMWSTYDGKKFTLPTQDYLYEIGVAQENTKMIEARLALEKEIVL